MALSLFWGIWLTTIWICACLSIFRLQKDWNSCHVNFHSFQKRESVFIYARGFFCKKNAFVSNSFLRMFSSRYLHWKTLNSFSFTLEKIKCMFLRFCNIKKIKVICLCFISSQKIEFTFLSFLKLAINKIHVFWVFLAFKKMESMFLDLQVYKK